MKRLKQLFIGLALSLLLVPLLKNNVYATVSVWSDKDGGTIRGCDGVQADACLGSKLDHIYMFAINRDGSGRQREFIITCSCGQQLYYKFDTGEGSMEYTWYPTANVILNHQSHYITGEIKVRSSDSGHNGAHVVAYSTDSTPAYRKTVWTDTDIGTTGGSNSYVSVEGCPTNITKSIYFWRQSNCGQDGWASFIVKCSCGAEILNRTELHSRTTSEYTWTIDEATKTNHNGHKIIGHIDLYGGNSSTSYATIRTNCESCELAPTINSNLNNIYAY